MKRLIMQFLPMSKYVNNHNNYVIFRCLHIFKCGKFNGFSELPCFGLKSNKTVEFPVLLNISRRLSLSVVHDSEIDGYANDIGMEDLNLAFPLREAVEIEEHSEQFRNTLFPDSKDAIMLQINSCNSVKQLVGILEDNVNNLKSEHYCQTILVMWDLLTSYCDVAALETGGRPMPYSMISSRYLSHSKCSTEHVLFSDVSPILYKALACISNDLKRLSTESLVCSILYSNRLGVSVRHPHMQAMFTEVITLLGMEDENQFPISALSRLTLVLNDTGDELWSKLALIKTMPLLYKHFDRCRITEDFRALTICMLSTVPYLREDLLLQYEGLTEEFLRNGTLTKNHSSIIVKSVLLLNHIYHRPTAREMIYKLLHLLQHNMSKLFLPHISCLQKVVRQNLEPHDAVRELENIRKKYSEKLMANAQVSPHFLHLYSLPSNPVGSSILKEAIASCDRLESALCVQTHVTTAYPEACHLLWLKVADLLDSGEHGSSALLQVCLRYINFRSRMGSYRCRQFESRVLRHVARELVDGTATHRPRELALLTAFVVAQGHTSLAADLLPRLATAASQFDASSCLMLSRGINLCMNQASNQLHVQLQLDSILAARTKEIMLNKTVKDNTVRFFNVMLRTCINRSRSFDNNLMWDILKRHEQLDWSQLTSRTLRNLVYNLQASSTLVPSAVDHMVEYCLDQRQYVLGDTAGKLAYLCYSTGYTPAHAHTFFSVTADLVTRDCDMMIGLRLLQVALALSYFNHLPPTLNSYIFTVSFLEKLDNEIKNCFAKDKYPVRVRQMLMQLNRSVCLDLPEADVPWFHTKYCEQLRALGQLDGRPRTLFFTDVQGTLSSLVSPSCLHSKANSPYGYTIDFQLNLDSTLNPVPVKAKENAVHKLAILLLHENYYTMYERRLKGYYRLKQRHLEILGYRVINLSDSLWNAMFMTEPKAKQEYLRKLIWPRDESSLAARVEGPRGWLEDLKKQTESLAYKKPSELAAELPLAERRVTSLNI